ncbi:MAG: hypothetical protein QM767_09585 [Anaeromyxobacter sp.]
MRHLTLICAAAAALVLAACGQEDTSNPADNVPDAPALTLELAGGAAEGLLEAGAPALLATTPDVNDELADAREKLAAVNTAVRSLFAQVAAVVATEGAPAPGQVTVYGPVTRCVVEGACDAGGSASFKLTVARAFGRTWAFTLTAQVGDEWKPVAAGWMHRGAVVRRGAGRVALNLENLRAAAPAYTGQGYLLGAFSSGPVAKHLHYRLVDFTPDPARWPAATAAFRGYKTEAGTTRVRVAGVKDLVGGEDTELGIARVAYNPALGGRAFSVVTNYTVDGVAHGDVPAGDQGQAQYWFGRACYAPGQTTPAFKEWFLCDRSVGPAACVLAQGGVGTPAAGADGATWQDTCALQTEPAEFAPPAGAPVADPTDGSAEAGDTTDPGTPPASPDDVTPPAE